MDYWRLLIGLFILVLQILVYAVYDFCRVLITRDSRAWIPSAKGQLISLLLLVICFFTLDFDSFFRLFPAVLMIPGLFAVLPLAYIIFVKIVPGRYRLFIISSALLSVADGFDAFLLVFSVERGMGMIPFWAWVMPLRHIIWYKAYRRTLPSSSAGSCRIISPLAASPTCLASLDKMTSSPPILPRTHADIVSPRSSFGFTSRLLNVRFWPVHR